MREKKFKLLTSALRHDLRGEIYKKCSRALPPEVWSIVYEKGEDAAISTMFWTMTQEIDEQIEEDQYYENKMIFVGPAKLSKP